MIVPEYLVLDAILASIYWKDLKGVYLGCNKYMLEMVGLSNRKEIIGKTDYQLPWKKEAHKLREIDELVIKENKSYQVEEYTTLKNGVKKVFLSSKAPLIGSKNKIVGIIGVSLNITEKKKLEEMFRETEKELEKFLQLKERFLRNISHEIRNPLQSFVIMSETLVDTWNKLKDKEKFEINKLIVKSAKRLSTIALNMLDLSELISNKVKLTLEKQNITELVKQTIENYKEMYPDNLNTEIILHTSKDYYVTCDKEKIVQVIHNLLFNANKWSNKGTEVIVTLHETFLHNANQFPGIQVCIKDQGIGIPKDELNMILEPFTESSKTASNAGGIGLGLSICNEIIKLHFGEFWAENNLISGCNFNFIIPVEDLTNILSSSNTELCK